MRRLAMALAIICSAWGGVALAGPVAFGASNHCVWPPSLTSFDIVVADRVFQGRQVPTPECVSVGDHSKDEKMPIKLPLCVAKITQGASDVLIRVRAYHESRP